jgi:hypothetical protein
VNLGEAPALAKILPGGEYKRGKMLEARESYKADTYGAMFGLNRQALINDDLGAFMDIAASTVSKRPRWSQGSWWRSSPAIRR